MVKCLGDFVLIDRLGMDKLDEMLGIPKRLIILPNDTAHGDPNRALIQFGRVVESGKGRVSPEGIRIPTGVEPGDFVLYRQEGPHEVKIDGIEGELFFLRDWAIEAIVA